MRNKFEPYWESFVDLAIKKYADKRAKEEIKELKETLEHRDSVLSIMYDLIRCDYIRPKHKLDIIKAVIDDECWNFDDLTEKEKELWNYFWKGWFR